MGDVPAHASSPRMRAPPPSNHAADVAVTTFPRNRVTSRRTGHSWTIGGWRPPPITARFQRIKEVIGEPGVNCGCSYVSPPSHHPVDRFGVNGQKWSARVYLWVKLSFFSHRWVLKMMFLSVLLELMKSWCSHDLSGGVSLFVEWELFRSLTTSDSMMTKHYDLPNFSFLMHNLGLHKDMMSAVFYLLVYYFKLCKAKILRSN